MSQYGAYNGRWAKIKTETDKAVPTYEPAISLGAVSKVTDSLTFTNLRAEGDDRVQDSLHDFVSGTVDIAYDAGCSNEALAAVHGATLDDDGGVDFSVADQSPYGGYGFLRRILHGSVKSFQGVLYVKTKAVLQGRDHNGKKVSGTVLTGDKIHMDLEAPKFGLYMSFSPEFATETEALAWLDQKLPLKTG
jgi:hypothetical protein